MFTGIIQALGKVQRLQSFAGGDLRLEAHAGGLSLEGCQPGDSIAVNGVCLTMTAIQKGGFQCDLSRETMQQSTLEELQPGAPLNLEKVLTPAGAMGGHWVSGHVDGVGSVRACTKDGRSLRCQLRYPQELGRYIAPKGAITVDGVSLTVNAVTAQEFGVNIIPHTLRNTILQHYRSGTRVNLEVDIIARYLERLLQQREAGL